jgi:hypothetical protein
MMVSDGALCTGLAPPSSDRCAVSHLPRFAVEEKGRAASLLTRFSGGGGPFAEGEWWRGRKAASTRRGTNPC